MKTLLLLFLLTFSSYPSLAQADWDQEIKEHYTLLSDLCRVEEYKEAQEHLEWLLENHPGIHRSVYIRGEKIYEQLAQNSKSKAQKKYFQKKIEDLRRNRIAIFGS